MKYNMSKITLLRNELESALLLYDKSLDEYNHTKLDSFNEEALSIELNELGEEIDLLRDKIERLEKG